MTEWFRLWHGAPTDPKWRTVARRASVRPGDVWAVVSCLMDRASQASERGCVSGYDVEIIADALGYEPDDVQRIIDALHDKAVIVSGRLASWEKYQPKREDGSAERGKEYRDRIKAQKGAEELARTQANAGERIRALDTEERREEKKENILVGQAAQQRQASDTSRGTRLPLDWQATPEMHSYAMDHGVPPEAIERMDTDFREHWIGKAGAAGRKADWTLTYQTWARREGDKHRARQRDPPRSYDRSTFRSPLD